MSNSHTFSKLAERTGIEALDAIIADYQLRDSFVDDMPMGLVRSLSDMRSPDKARNMCETVSADFLTFAKQHPALGEWKVFVLKDADSRLWGLDMCVDYDCGDPHTVVIFTNDDEIHSVDFTSAQYNCNLFPTTGQLSADEIKGLRRGI